jgi:hypothetical protein
MGSDSFRIRFAITGRWPNAQAHRAEGCDS